MHHLGLVDLRKSSTEHAGGVNHSPSGETIVACQQGGTRGVGGRVAHHTAPVLSNAKTFSPFLNIPPAGWLSAGRSLTSISTSQLSMSHPSASAAVRCQPVTKLALGFDYAKRGWSEAWFRRCGRERGDRCTGVDSTCASVSSSQPRTCVGSRSLSILIRDSR